MKLASIPHAIHDREAGVTYIVMAYRNLRREEVVQMVRVHRSQTRKKPKNGSRITIFTSIGALEGQ